MLDDSLGRLASRWVGSVQRHASATLWACAFLTLAALLYTATTLGLNTNENDLFSDEISYFALRDEFNRAFPSLVDPIIVVVDAETLDQSQAASDALTRRLRRDTEHFAGVYRPAEGEFFERHGLLYLGEEELEELVENLFAVQPYLARLSREPNLHAFLSALADAVDACARGEIGGEHLAEVIERVAGVVSAHLEGVARPISWAELITGRGATPRERRRFLLVQPVVDFEQLQPAESTLRALDSAIEEIEYGQSGGVRIRATGIFPLSYEEMEHLGQQTSWAGAASLLLVSILLLAGLRSPRLVLASLVTLLVGLVWTAGFAAAAIGHLNLISVAFGVLFIGLSIDFAIHLCMRYQERRRQDIPWDVALRDAAARVGGSLAICATTTAVGFFAFVPTAYAGVAELGIIAGAGMFISLFTNLTLLPALIFRVDARSAGPRAAPRAAGSIDILALPVRHARAVLTTTALAAVVALAAIPQIRFDANPLRVRDPATDSVQVLNEMLADGDALPWNLNVIASDLETADSLAARLEALPQVDMAVTLRDFVPERQAEKLAILQEAAFLLLPTFPEAPPRSAAEPTDPEPALAALEHSLTRLTDSSAPAALRASATHLRGGLAVLRERVAAGSDARLAGLEAAVIGSLPERLRLLRRSLEPAAVGLADLPPDLVEHMQARDGRARIEVFPQDDLNDPDALEAYVASVQGLAPRAFGEGLVILESGRVVVDALRQALFTASALVLLLLLALWRDVRDLLLVALPLALAMLFTTVLTLPLGISFNFANVIVIPLLLGMGVDTGIHLVHRHRAEHPHHGNLLRTSTAGAVLLSALTTAASFGTLGLSSHQGMASLGQLLSLGIAVMLACNLIVLPALIRLATPGRVAG